MQFTQGQQASLIVLTGRPASGKTTLVRRLAPEIRCPLISRDEIKEGLVNTLENNVSAGFDLNRHVYKTFFETIKFLLNRKITVIAEAAFQHKLWMPELEPLMSIARIRIIYCVIDAQLAKSRFIERAMSDPDREGFHENQTTQSSKEGITIYERDYDPPQLAVPTLSVDTSNGYQPTFEEIISFAKSKHP